MVRERRQAHAVLALALGVLALVAGGCARSGQAPPSLRSSGPSFGPQRAALQLYVGEVEPIRLAVNSLLEGADPILSAYSEHHLPAKAAAKRMGELEHRFAAYTVQIHAIEPRTPALRQLHAPYAHTYILEDAYLSALTTGLAEGNLDGLPDTQAGQRAAIIQWRTELTVLADRLGVSLPSDLQQAGRGEIAPSPDGS
jgi:hypothetical protein